MTAPVIPAYGTGTLADLLPSVSARLGLRGATDVLGLPSSRSYVVLLVDGLGWEQRGWWETHAPFLHELASDSRPLTSGVPSTTSTSITSLGTGLTPGAHGIAGYSFFYRPIGKVLNTLVWEAGVHGLDVQPQLTCFERLSSAGIRTATVCPARFEGSGLTTIALRGPGFIPVKDENDHRRRVELTTDAVASADRTLVYVYERSLDHCGHGTGVGSEPWLAALTRVDALTRALREALPSDVALLVIGDHGMVNVPAEGRLVVEDEPGLLDGVAVFAGEGRLRQLYTSPRQLEAVLARWRERLGDNAWVSTRDEAFAAGWFGERNRRVEERFGDVLVAMRGTSAVMTRSLPNELSLVGMHGSLTPDEMFVPLLVC